MKLVLRPTDPTSPDQPFRPAPPGRWEIGRGADSSWCLADASVSRRHAALENRGSGWTLVDLGSKHGTKVNGVPVLPRSPVPVEPGDIITLGRWACRCGLDDDQRRSTLTVSDEGAHAGVTGFPPNRLAGLDQQSLDTLMNLCSEINGANSESSVADAVVRATSQATRCPRVSVLRRAAGANYEVLAMLGDGAPAISKRLLEAAGTEGLASVGLTNTDRSQSIIDLGISTALASPIRVEETPLAFLVLDSRGQEAQLSSDTGAFVRAVAELAGLALERLRARVMNERHETLHRDLDAARRAQEFLMPVTSGVFDGISYAYRSLPGRVVAGDFVDVLPLGEGRAAFIVGDVSGKGVGAAVLMAAAQSHLRALLVRGSSLEDAVQALNRDLSSRTESSKFVTLAATMLDRRTNTLEIVDAGHGMCAVRPAAGQAALLDATSGPPLGVDESSTYRAVRSDFAIGDHLVLFSDGVVEQSDPEDKFFGIDRALQSINKHASPGDIVEGLVQAVVNHAAGPLSDDLTVGSVELL